MKLDKIQLQVLYAQAKASYRSSTEEHPVLSQEELGISWDSITVVEESVCIRFSRTDSKSYEVQTRLTLSAPTGETIGWYRLDQDEENIVDDFLVLD